MAECLAERRMVLLMGAGETAVIVGALQTQASVVKVSHEGGASAVDIEGDEVTVRAAKQLSLRVGDSAIELSADGEVSVSGERVSIDASWLLQLLAAVVQRG